VALIHNGYTPDSLLWSCFDVEENRFF
jgi:hypothetical protein